MPHLLQQQLLPSLTTATTLLLLLLFLTTNSALAVVDISVKKVSARQRSSIGHGFPVDYSVDGIRHARSRDGDRFKKVMMMQVACYNLCTVKKVLLKVLTIYFLITRSNCLKHMVLKFFHCPQ